MWVGLSRVKGRSFGVIIIKMHCIKLLKTCNKHKYKCWSSDIFTTEFYNTLNEEPTPRLL